MSATQPTKTKAPDNRRRPLPTENPQSVAELSHEALFPCHRPDLGLELAWLNLKIQGTRFMQAKQVERRIQSLNLKSKAANVAGLQLVTPSWKASSAVVRMGGSRAMG
jgi:hypothetical protein